MAQGPSHKGPVTPGRQAQDVCNWRGQDALLEYNPQNNELFFNLEDNNAVYEKRV